MEIILTEKIMGAFQGKPDLIISLTADDRTRSRQRLELEDGQIVFLNLPRGTGLREGDILRGQPRGSSPEILAQITAKPEPVITVRAKDPFKLLQAAYHLGNRHVPLEITPDHLRLTFDPVLARMLEHLGLEIKQEILPFQPEAGAYGHSHGAGSQEPDHHHPAQDTIHSSDYGNRSASDYGNRSASDYGNRSASDRPHYE